MVVRSRRRIVAGDGGIGRDDLRVRRGDRCGLGIGAPFHDEMLKGGAGAVAELVVIHHAPWDFDLVGEMSWWRAARAGRGGVGSEQQSPRWALASLVCRLLSVEGMDSALGRSFQVTLFCASVGAVVELS